MPDIILSITDDQYKAMKYFIDDPEQWIRNVLEHKIKKCVDRAVLEVSDLNPKKVSMVDKLQIIKTSIKSNK